MILLDTHVIVWMLFEDRRLGRRTRRLIDAGWSAGDVAVSTMSYWEVGMRTQKGQLDFPLELDVWRREMLEQGLVEIPVHGGIAIRAGLLQDMHGDPADRIIVATALEGHQLVTADPRILDWLGHLMRLDATT